MDAFLHDPIILSSLLGLGVTVGPLAGLLGVGGGVISVPGLFLLFKYLGFPEELIMHLAVGTSLAIIVPTGLRSAHAHWEKKAVDLDAAKRIGLGVVAGSALGVLIADYLSGFVLGLIFAIAITILAGIMVANPARFKLYKKVPPQLWSGLAGSVIGLISTLVGIGGGSLNVPYMTLCGMSIHRAIGTSAALGLFIAVPASIGFVLIGLQETGLPPYSLGFVYLPSLAVITVAAVSSAPFGAALAHKAPVEIMRKGFAIFMVLLAIKMIVQLFS